MSKKVAICLRGAISKITNKFKTAESLYNNGKYINYKAVYNSIMEHIINANPQYEFDFYIHCWNIDLENELVKLYNPKSYLFENNNNYKDEIINDLINTKQPLNNFGVNSQFLSMTKSLKLMQDNLIDYQYVILYRPDVLLFKNIDLNLYKNDEIYVNGHQYGGGDFHVIMNLKNSYDFINIYNTTKTINPVTTHDLHGKIKIFVEYFLNKKIFVDDILPGIHQEVVRQLKYCSIDLKKIPIEYFYKYGLTHDELLSYNVI